MSDDKVSLERVQEALRAVTYPGFHKDILTLGVVQRIQPAPEGVKISLRLPGGQTTVPADLERAIGSAMNSLGLRVALEVASGSGGQEGQPAAPADDEELLEGVGAVVAVSSAKGGVGKSTVATNLACAFAARGLSTGLLDADVYGPSLPILMGTDERPEAAGGGRFHPIERHGVKCISMGLFLDESSPVIWRGPMVAGLLQQFLRDCAWGELDVLVVDLPPGTGDTQLTLAQRVRVNGAILVTTPQEVALRDVVRGLEMFRKVQVPLLGVVENMSHFRCPSCGAEEALFGHDGGVRLAEEAGLPLLAQIPVDPEVWVHGDGGQPIVGAALASDSARVFSDLAERVSSMVGLVPAGSVT